MEILRAIKELQRDKKHKCKHLQKGKSVPGKNLSKNSQCDGNDDEPGTSVKKGRKNRAAARNARPKIAQQSQMVDNHLPEGDKDYEPDFEHEESDDDGDESINEGMHCEQDNESSDDFQSATSQPQYSLGGGTEYCWVESFDLDINSKRVDAFSIPSKIFA